MKKLISISFYPVRTKIAYTFLLVISVLVFSRCANPVSPTGGPKDNTPPTILNCSPPNHSINFTTNNIKITFDEFVQIKDPNHQILISPPYLPNTDFKLRGKSIIVQFDDTLKSNTTYSINFGEAISDITENNVLKDFSYVFSTGSYIDSLSYEGLIVDAFNLSPQKDVFAMLYLDNNDTIPFDSLPCKVKPYYLTRTGEKGEFRLDNLNNAHFKLFALKDLNSDFLYNLPEEKIGFVDSLITASYHPLLKADTSKKDSIKKSDTLTITIPENEPDATIRLFQQYDSVQRLLKSTLVQEGEVALYFRYPLKQPRFIPLNFLSSLDWKIEEYSRNKDTVFIWLKNVPADSLYLRVSDNEKVLDTIRLDLTQKSDKKKSEKKEGVKEKRLLLFTNLRGSNFKQFKHELTITFAYPLLNYSFSRVILVDGKDTVHPKLMLPDSVKRVAVILYKWKEDKKYKVIIPDSSFFSINNLTNDSLVIGFRTNMEKEYGSLQVSVKIESHPGHYIIQLLDEKDNIIESQQITSSGKIRFEYLNPKKYKIKAILDKNNNGRWDTGAYFKKLEPEEVFFFPKTLEIRANWEVEESWDL